MRGLRRPVARAVGATALLAVAVVGPLAGPAHPDEGHEHGTEQQWWPAPEDDAPDHGSHAPADDAGGDDHGGHDHGTPTAPAEDRPLAVVLGAFALVNGAVLVGAGVTRHRERAATGARRADRAARRAVPAPPPGAVP